MNATQCTHILTDLNDRPSHEKYYLHEYILALWGMPLGEMLDLEKLSETCKKYNRWFFFFTSAPFNTPGKPSCSCSGRHILIQTRWRQFARKRKRNLLDIREPAKEYELSLVRGGNDWDTCMWKCNSTSFSMAIRVLWSDVLLDVVFHSFDE